MKLFGFLSSAVLRCTVILGLGLIFSGSTAGISASPDPYGGDQQFWPAGHRQVPLLTASERFFWASVRLS
jgi:hypothetical protein